MNADLDQPLVDVLYLFVPKNGAVGISGIIGEQGVVMLEVGAAAAGVGDYGVEVFGRELIDLLSGEFAGGFPFTVMSVERAATMLLRRRDDFAAVLREHFDRVTIDVAENQVLGATRKHRDAILSSAMRRSDRSYEVG